MRTEVIEVRTGGSETVHDLTRDCQGFVEAEGDGLLHVWVPHATAGLAVLETGAGSDADLLAALRELLPVDDRWRTGTGRLGTGATTCCRPSARRTRRCRSSAGGSRWAPGSPSAWST